MTVVLTLKGNVVLPLINCLASHWRSVDPFGCHGKVLQGFPLRGVREKKTKQRLPESEADEIHLGMQKRERAKVESKYKRLSAGRGLFRHGEQCRQWALHSFTCRRYKMTNNSLHCQSRNRNISERKWGGSGELWYTFGLWQMHYSATILATVGRGISKLDI